MSTILNPSFFLIYISQNNNDDMFDEIKSFIDQGADYHYNNDYPFYLTSLKNNPKTTKYLLDKGCNIKKNIQEAFFGSIYKKNIEMVKLLLDYGADVNANKSEALKSACCIPEKDFNLIKLLLEYNANIQEVLDHFYIRNDLELVKLFFEYKPDLDLSKTKILLEFCSASENDAYYEMVKFFLDKGARLDNYNTNPLEWSVHQNNFRITKLFMEKGIEITERAIKILSEYSKNDSHLEIVKLFYDAGANFDFVDFESSNVQIIKLIHEEFEGIEFRKSDICPISQETFQEGDDKLGCVKCLNVFKKGVLKEWLTFNNICPMCRSCSRFQKV